MTTGKVKWFNEKKKFGFIVSDDDGSDVFVHLSDAPAGLKDGDKVSFELGEAPKGVKAVNVKFLNG